MLILSTDFWDVHLADSQPLSEITWKPTASRMKEAEFMAHLRAFVEVVHKYRIKRFLVDSRTGHFTMNVEIQTWHDTEIVPHYLQAGIEKIAFVVPEHDFVAMVSIEQTFDEAQAKQLQTRYFDSLSAAKTWIEK